MDDGGATARGEALRRLLRIEEGAYIGLEAGDGDLIDARESRQALDYVAGVTRWRRRLDFILSQFYRGDLSGMEPALRQILRIGLYDILFLETVEYAAVNEAVALAKSRVRRGAGGLVNGVLRSVLRAKNELPEPNTGDPAEDLAISHSHPTWMVRRWLDRYGREDTIALLNWNNDRPQFGVRINTLKIAIDEFKEKLRGAGAEWEESRFLPYFIRVRNVQPLLKEKLLREGFCAIQDESAGMIVRLLDPQPGDHIVDACAAPGGKAIHMAQLMRNEGSITAVDVHEGRLSLVRRASTEHGAGIVSTRAADFRAFNGEWTGKADRVLVDAPCSGLGVLSKRADLRWRREETDLMELTELQDAILDSAAGVVKPGGILVYGTCTIEPEENEMRVEAFLSRHPEFQIEGASDFVPAELTHRGYYATFPPKDRIDGAYAARLRRIKP